MVAAVAAPAGAHATRRPKATSTSPKPVVLQTEPVKPPVLDDTVTEFTLERNAPVVFFNDTYELKLGTVTMGFLQINGKEFPMTHIQAEPRSGKAPQTWIMKIPGYATFRLSEVKKSGVNFRVLRNPNGDVHTPS